MVLSATMNQQLGFERGSKFILYSTFNTTNQEDPTDVSPALKVRPDPLHVLSWSVHQRDLIV